MALMYVPRQPGMQNQMFQVLTNLMFQKMAHKQRMDLVDRQLQAEQIALQEQRSYAEGQEKDKRVYTEEQKKKERESQLLEKGYVEAPPDMATTLPTVAGMNVGAQKDMIKDPITGKAFRKPEEEQWERVPDIIVDGKKIPVQRSKKTGKYQTLGTGPNITINAGKTLPAEEASKIGEFQVYKQTMDQIQSMVDDKKIDTGPFEFLKKRSDDWGVLPKKSRIELRTMVARLPGLMYAMRGKQLSDKELEVALEMMPKMSQDEKAFSILLTAS